MSGIDRVGARLIDALVKSIGVEELALSLSRISVVASKKDGARLRREGRSSGNLVINAREVVSQRESSSKPGPLKSPGTISKAGRNVNSSLARVDESRGSVGISSVRLRRVRRSTASNFVAIDLRNASVESGHIVRIASGGP